jgi:SAM-dependent methyltransferase
MAWVTDPHPIAAEGYGQGAQVYARGRPGFPPQALDWMKHELLLGPGRLALELGAGTGKVTKLLARTGVGVIAVEPVAAMLALLAAELPAVKTLRATAEDLPLASSSADAVICAQAFHWFATAEALGEIHRVLKPGGVLGLIWNVRDQSVGWVARLTEIMAPYEGDAPRFDHGEWRRVFPARGFGELQEKSFPHMHVGSAERVIVDRVASVSFIAALDDPTRAGVLDQVRALIAATPQLAGHEEVSFPYFTRAYWCHALS